MRRCGICFLPDSRKMPMPEPLTSKAQAAFAPPAPALPADEAIVFLDACEHGDAAHIAGVLKTHPAAANLVDDAGLSALHHAVSWASMEVMELLLPHVENIEFADATGQSPRELAARLGYHTMSDAIEAESQRRQAEAQRFQREELSLFTTGLPAATPVRQRPIRFKPGGTP